jgi:parvulin-like peptidyl-prolyl isomerase
MQNSTTQKLLKDTEFEDTCKKGRVISLIKNGAITILVILLLAVSFSFFAYKSPLHSVVSDFENSPGSVLTLQKISDADSPAVIAQLKSVCKGLDLNEIYIAQMSKKTGQQIIYVVNPLTGAIECKRNMADATAAVPSTLTPNIVADVNGDPVYSDEVLAVYNSVAASMRTNQTLQQAFEQVVNNKLLLQDAKRKGLNVTAEEIDNGVNSFISSNGLTFETLQQALQQSNSTITEFRNKIEDGQLIQKAILDATKDVAEITESDIWNFYSENKNNITSLASQTSRQLTIYANTSNAPERLEYLKGIASMINQTNFCDLIKIYSEDVSTKESCGFYNATQGQLLPEYEQAVFNSTPGELKIIGTRVGYHLVQIISINPSRPLSYEEARKDISNGLNLMKKQQVLLEYLAKLRQSAKIVTYSSQD